MNEIARHRRIVQRPRRPDAPSPADRLLDLARRVERLAVGGRTDPETILIGKLTVAQEMRVLARELAP